MAEFYVMFITSQYSYFFKEKERKEECTLALAFPLFLFLSQVPVPWITFCN